MPPCMIAEEISRSKRIQKKVSKLDLKINCFKLAFHFLIPLRPLALQLFNIACPMKSCLLLFN